VSDYSKDILEKREFNETVKHTKIYQNIPSAYQNIPKHTKNIMDEEPGFECAFCERSYKHNYFFDVNRNKKYPNTVDSKDPAKTPILTPSIYLTFSTKARFPTNKLIVNPIPVKIETPYKLNQFELLGGSANFNLIDT
jgi:hypothetical protein